MLFIFFEGEWGEGKRFPTVTLGETVDIYPLNHRKPRAHPSGVAHYLPLGKARSWAFLLSHLWELPKVRSQSSLQPGGAACPSPGLDSTTLLTQTLPQAWVPAVAFPCWGTGSSGAVSWGAGVNPTAATSSLAVWAWMGLFSPNLDLSSLTHRTGLDVHLFSCHLSQRGPWEKERVHLVQRFLNL